jgi:hypothetical protein
MAHCVWSTNLSNEAALARVGLLRQERVSEVNFVRAVKAGKTAWQFMSEQQATCLAQLQRSASECPAARSITQQWRRLAVNSWPSNIKDDCVSGTRDRNSARAELPHVKRPIALWSNFRTAQPLLGRQNEAWGRLTLQRTGLLSYTCLYEQ